MYHIIIMSDVYIFPQNTTIYTKQIADIIGSDKKAYSVINVDNVRVQNISRTAYGLVIAANINMCALNIPHNIEYMYIQIGDNQKMLDDMSRVIPSSVKTLCLNMSSCMHLYSHMIPSTIKTLIVVGDITIHTDDMTHIETLGITSGVHVLCDKHVKFNQIEVMEQTGKMNKPCILLTYGNVAYYHMPTDDVNDVITDYSESIYFLNQRYFTGGYNCISVDSPLIAELYQEPNINIRFHRYVTHNTIHRVDILTDHVIYDISEKKYWEGYVSEHFCKTACHNISEIDFINHINNNQRLLEDIRNYPTTKSK